MLTKKNILIYSTIFKCVTALQVIPFTWSYKNQTLTVTKSKVRLFLWYLVCFVQFGHFGFLTYRLLESIQKELKPALLLFQYVWNAIFMIPVFGQLSTILRMHEGSGSITSWLKIESAEETFTKNTLQAFFIVFFPIGGLQCLAQVFMYIRNPNMPQYIISFLLEHIDVSKENLPNYLILFGCLEITLGIYLWSLVFFYMSAILGCATTIKERIQSLRDMKNITKATVLYRKLFRFVVAFEDANVVVTMAIKVCVCTCTIVGFYNMLMFNLPPLPYMLMPLTVAASMVVFVYVLIPLCWLNVISRECIEKREMEAARNSWERKSWASFRPIRMTIGLFYSLDKKVVLHYFNFIVLNVINIILFFPE